MLLGSDELSPDLMVALERLGGEVIVQPAVTNTNASELSAVVEQLQPDFVVTAAGTIPGPALEAISAHTELVPSARAVRLTADREGLRRLAADELGLPTAPFWFAGSLEELQAVAAHAGFPLLVKPVAGPARPGQSVAAGPEDVASAWQRAAGPQHRVLAEAVVEVEVHVTLLVVRSEGPNGPVIDFCTPIGHDDVDAELVESWQPQQMSTAAMDAARSVAARMIKALGGRGVFGVELMISGDEVYFADVTAGPGQSSWVTLCSQRLSAFDLQARAIMGLPVDTMMVSPGACQLVKPGHETGGGMPSPHALTGALGVPESDVRVFGRAPSRVLALATGPDLATARERARQVASQLSTRTPRG